MEKKKTDELLYVQSHLGDDDVSSPCFLFAASCCCSLVFPFSHSGLRSGNGAAFVCYMVYCVRAIDGKCSLISAMSTTYNTGKY